MSAGLESKGNHEIVISTLFNAYFQSIHQIVRAAVNVGLESSRNDEKVLLTLSKVYYFEVNVH